MIVFNPQACHSRRGAPLRLIATRANNQPAVWVVNPVDQTVALRSVELVRHDPGHVVVGSGLSAGDIVVTAGVQALRPGQKVRLLGGAAR